jgi:hypothetical protein
MNNSVDSNTSGGARRDEKMHISVHVAL